MTPADALRDIRGGLLFGALYWSESLAARSIVIDPAVSRPINFGYNSRELTVLAFSVLTGAGIVVFRQSSGYPASAWVLVGPLLAWRFLYDVLQGFQLAGAEERATKGAFGIRHSIPILVSPSGTTR